MWYWHKIRHTDKWNKNESQTQTQTSMGNSFLKRLSGTLNMGNSSLLTKWCLDTSISTCKRNYLNSFFFIHKSYSKWINALNIKAKTTKFLKKIQKQIFMTLHLTMCSYMTPQAWIIPKHWINWTIKNFKKCNHFWAPKDIMKNEQTT